MTIDIVEVEASQKPVLGHLMQLYLYDLSAVAGWDIGDDGLFGSVERIERFWTVGQRHSFLIRSDGRVAGYVLVRRGTQFTCDGDGHEIAGLFVLRRYRRRGIGERAACFVFDRFPGRWEVVEMAANVDAHVFWLKTIDRYMNGIFNDTMRHGKRWSGWVQHFDNGLRTGGW